MKRLLTKRELSLLLDIEHENRNDHAYHLKKGDERVAEYLAKRGFVELKNNEAWVESLGKQYVLAFSQQEFLICQKLEKADAGDLQHEG